MYIVLLYAPSVGVSMMGTDELENVEQSSCVCCGLVPSGEVYATVM